MKGCVLIIILFFLSTTAIFPQVNNVNNIGSIKGVLRDSVYNHALKSATVSVYALPSEKLISYQVTNNLGEFLVKNLPLSTDLRLLVSSIGYQQVQKKFKIDTDTKVLDFKTILTNQKTTLLKEVSVTIPPLQMNGDTLEFNAAAFNLDSNAVVQDLMKKITNITLWGDGKITVNGREIKSLLVNGKEFMGGDAKVAIENIPKNAVDKIQVYNVLNNPSNILDTILNMNLKLKKGKDFGYFGKIGAGYGSGNRFEADASFNFFSPKLQLSLVAAGNNVNKVAPDINTILRNNTFKGVGVQVDYMSDFRTIGLNRPRSTGYSLKYDFSDEASKNDKLSSINSEYFMHSNRISQEGNSQTTTAITGIGNIFEINRRRGNDEYTNQNFHAGYQYSKNRYSFNLSQQMNINTTKSENESENESFDENLNLVSESRTSSSNKNTNKSYGLNLDFNLGPRSIVGDHRFSGFNFLYTFNVHDRYSDRKNLTNFESQTNPSSDSWFNRNYKNASNDLSQRLYLQLPDLTNLIFGVGQFKLFELNLKSDLRMDNKKSNDMVVDFDAATSRLVENDYLTNNATFTSLIYEPVLEFQKVINKSLSNRFDRNWYFYFNLKSQVNVQKNRSNHNFQNIDRSYRNFLPQGGISFSNSEYGEYSSEVSLAYEKKATVPTIAQLVPLTDSANVYYLRMANPNLMEENNHSLTASFKRVSEKKNNFDYKLVASYQRTADKIVDSTIVDQQNVRTVFNINNSNNHSYSITGNVNKGMKFKSGEIQLSFNSAYSLNHDVNIINSIEQEMVTNLLNNNLSIFFSYKSDLAVEAKQYLINTFTKYYTNDQDVFRSSSKSTFLSTSYNLTKKLTVNSNISFSSNRSEKSEPINYTIWNASTSYRLLKGNNLEFKFSALDLLGQNTSVINLNTGRSITLGTQRVLQKYFLVGISYYPRKFGKSQTK